ncbi:hypothetical protein CD118_03510 [Staphylococcus coagulans]|nr:hypothetical protein [Staphylococcus schleiferi]NHB72221.1 hypothetical protein [Staphylococcus sp. 191]PNZ12071.1 hypothetical protein CD118_03510 [Staphylococcus coagulans]
MEIYNMTTKTSPKISLLSLAVLIEKRAEWEAYEPVNTAAYMIKQEKLAAYNQAIAKCQKAHPDNT